MKTQTKTEATKALYLAAMAAAERAVAFMAVSEFAEAKRALEEREKFIAAYKAAVAAETEHA
jgi:hypothetical protein